MKTYEILLFTVTIVACQSISYSQNDSLLTQSTPSTFQSNAFKVLAGGINAIYSHFDRLNIVGRVGVLEW